MKCIAAIAALLLLAGLASAQCNRVSSIAEFTLAKDGKYQMEVRRDFHSSSRNRNNYWFGSYLNQSLPIRQSEVVHPHTTLYWHPLHWDQINWFKRLEEMRMQQNKEEKK